MLCQILRPGGALGTIEHQNPSKAAEQSDRGQVGEH
jgi:hypothetical protein